MTETREGPRRRIMETGVEPLRPMQRLRRGLLARRNMEVFLITYC